MKRVKKQNLASNLYSMIKKEILNIDLKSGEKINISKIANSAGVSLSPVREAVTRLVGDGLVVHNQRSGYFVIKFDSEDIRDLFRFRKLLENEALSDFQVEHKGKLKEIKRKILDLKKLNNWEKNREKIQKIDEKLHSTLISFSHSLRLKKFFFHIWDQVKLAQHIDTEISRSLEDHVGVINSLLNDNIIKARKILLSHINDTEKRLIKILKD